MSTKIAVAVEPEEDGVYIPNLFLRLFPGDLNTAALLSQIFYWYRPSKNTGLSKLRVSKGGVWWLVKSSKNWESEVGLTSDQSRRSLSVLRDMGIITTQVMGYAGAPTLHLRFSFIVGKQTLKSPEQVLTLSGVSLPISGISQMHLPNSPDASGIFSKSNTETTTQTTTQTTNAMNAQDILQAKKQGTPGKPENLKTEAKGPTALALLWKKRVSLEEGGFVKPLTGKQVGQLKHVHAALGDKAMPVLDWCLQNWITFLLAVRAAKGLSTFPEKPDTGFFCSYYDIAINCIAKAEAKKSPPALVVTPPPPKKVVIAEKQPVTVEMVPVPDGKVTLADLAEGMAMLDAIYKGKK